MLAQGQRLDRYELIRPIARGGMGEIWLGRLSRLHGFEKLVAIKSILPRFARDPRFREMFLDEARLAVRIDHPNVAQVFDLGEDGDVLFLVMEWIDGHPLDVVEHHFRCRSERVPEGLALRVVAEAAAGLHAAHEARSVNGEPLGIVHRDVSPQNLLLTERGTVKVIDFGIARARQGLSSEAGSDRVRGKAPYMAPEQAMGHAVDARADVWALGAVLFELISGAPPVKNLGELAALLDGRSRIAPLDTSRDVQTIVQRALSVEPAARYPTAEALRRDLEAALATRGPMTTAAHLADLLARHVPRALVHLGAVAETTQVRLLRQDVRIEDALPVSIAQTTPISEDERDAQLREESRMRRLVDRYEHKLEKTQRRRAEIENELRLGLVGELEVRRARERGVPISIVVYRTRRPELVTPSNDLAAVLDAVRGGAATFSEYYGEVVLVAPGESAAALNATFDATRLAAGKVVALEPHGAEGFRETVRRARDLSTGSRAPHPMTPAPSTPSQVAGDTGESSPRAIPRSRPSRHDVEALDEVLRRQSSIVERLRAAIAAEGESLALAPPDEAPPAPDVALAIRRSSDVVAVADHLERRARGDGARVYVVTGRFAEAALRPHDAIHRDGDDSLGLAWDRPDDLPADAEIQAFPANDDSASACVDRWLTRPRSP